MTDWRIEPLRAGHDRAEFGCGQPSLDDFLHQRVTQYEKRNLGRTYVAVAVDGSRLYGYYTLASAAIGLSDLPETLARKLPRHPVPVVLLARLAVDQSVQGRRLGESLLVDALRRCLRLADELGIHGVEVDAIDTPAERFYLKYGFVPLLDRERHLFLPIATVRGIPDPRPMAGPGPA
jgi:GNAT superfamily N-acetyltransferase